MASESNSIWKAYRFPIILLTAIVIGCIVGAVMGKDALVFKPLGDVFINAMFMVVVRWSSQRSAAPSPICLRWSGSAR